MSWFSKADEVGIDNMRLILIKEYKVIDRDHLRTKEQMYIGKYRRLCCNSNAAFHPLLNSGGSKEYHRLYNKVYRESHMEYFREYQKNYYKENKERVFCECGCEVYDFGMANHLQTDKHKNMMQLINE